MAYSFLNLRASSDRSSLNHLLLD